MSLNVTSRLKVLLSAAQSVMILIGKLLYEPLLGTYLHENKKTIQFIFAYLVINIFALTSGLSPAQLSIIPDSLTQSYVLLMTISTLLTLRLAYYQSFCLNDTGSLESQIGHVLMSSSVLTSFLAIFDFLPSFLTSFLAF